MESTPRNPLSILAAPRSNAANNIIDLLYQGVAKNGVHVDPFTFGRLISGNYQIAHIHWPEHMFLNGSSARRRLRIIAGCAALVIARFRGVRIVRTVHNLTPHKRPNFLIRLFLRFLDRHTDSYIFLNRSSLSVFKEQGRLGKRKAFVIPHGSYGESLGSRIEKSLAREKLGLAQDQFVFLHFGQIREYKNSVHLARAFTKYPGESCQMLFAGKPESEQLERELNSLAQTDPRIRLVLKFINDSDIHLYFSAADVVILPYRDINNSGVAILAAGFDCPVAVAHRGGMEEMREEIGPEWVHLIEDELTPDIFQEIRNWERDSRQKRQGRAIPEAWHPGSIAERTVAVYRDALD